MLSDEFLYELTQTSKRLGVKPMDLLSVMERESGINPAAYNENGGATGLIQFMPSTAKGLGTTTEALRNMSAVEQLPFVEKFYKQAGFKGGNAGDLYATTFLPARAGRDVLTTEGESFYDANKVLDTNNDGRITTEELAKRAESGYRNVRGLLSNREISPGGVALPFDINERGVPTEFIPPTPMNLPSIPAPKVEPQGVPQDMPQVAPQAAPQAQPKERSFLDRAIDFASNVGAPLQQLGQGVALLEGDLQSAQALGQMVEGNRKREQIKAKERAAVKILTDMGYSDSGAKNLIDAGYGDAIFASALESKFGDAKFEKVGDDLYRISQDGEVTRVVKGAPGTSKVMKSELDLLKSYRAEQAVKDFSQISSSFRKIRGAAQGGTSADDLTLIFSFMKLLDPGSVVRGDEFANAENTAGVPGRIRNLYNKAKLGERLNPQQRRGFVESAQRIYEQESERVSNINQQYLDRANRFGVDPNFINAPRQFEPIEFGVESPPQSYLDERPEDISDDDWASSWAGLTEEQKAEFR